MMTEGKGQRCSLTHCDDANAYQELHPRQYSTYYEAVEKAMDFLGYNINKEHNYTIARPNGAPPSPPAPGVVVSKKKTQLEKLFSRTLGRKVPYTYGR